jgi:hypothetical protein
MRNLNFSVSEFFIGKSIDDLECYKRNTELLEVTKILKMKIGIYLKKSPLKKFRNKALEIFENPVKS